MAPKFFVIARVVGKDGGMSLWKERLVHLCEVSATEPYGDSYFWGSDLDGEPDTLWGLEGYTHPIGFFIDHVSSDIFKREMALVDEDNLLKNTQGLGSPDYDLHHYDEDGGFLKRPEDPNRHSAEGHVVVYHTWALDSERRPDVLRRLSVFVDELRRSNNQVQSALVLKECRDATMSTLWLRFESQNHWEALRASSPMQNMFTSLAPNVTKTELHQSHSFIGHLDMKS